MLGRVIPALAVAALGLVLAAPDAAAREVRFEGDVLRISYERDAFLTQVEVRGRMLDVIVKAREATVVTEDGAPAAFDDIVVGDHVQVHGAARRHRAGRVLVVARQINIDNSRAELTGSVRIRGQVLRLSCERRAALVSVRGHEIILVPRRDALITLGRDVEIDFCRIPVGACFAAAGERQKRGDRVVFVAHRIAVLRCPE